MLKGTMAAPERLAPAVAVALCLALLATILSGPGPDPTVRGEVSPSSGPSATDPSSAAGGDWTATNVTLGPPGGYPTATLVVSQTAQVFTTVYPSYVVVVSATTGAIVARIDVGEQVSELAYDNVTNEVLVGGPSTGELFAIDVPTDRLTRTLALPQPAAAMSFDGANGELLVMIRQVTNVGNGSFTVGGTILVMDGRQSSYPLLTTLTNIVSYGWFPNGFAGSMTVDSLRQVVYVSGAIGFSGYEGIQWFELSSPSVAGSYFGGGGISTFDAQTDTVYVQGGPVECPCYTPWQISVISGMTHNITGVITANSTTSIVSMAVDPVTQRLYELDSAGGVYAIDTGNNTVVASYSLPSYCGAGVSVDVQTGSVFIADECTDQLLVLAPTDGLVSRITVGGGAPAGIAYDSRTNDIVVANALANNLTVIDGATDAIVATVPVGAGPDALAFDSANGYAYVADSGTDSVTVFNGGTEAVVGSIPVGSYPDAVAYDSGNSYVYVANFDSDNLSVIDGATEAVVGAIPVGSAPVAVAYDSANGYVYTANEGGNVTIVDGASDTVVGSVPVGSSCDGVASDSANGYIYTANESGNVTVVNGATTTVVGSVPVGSDPDGVAYGNANGYVYVVNWGSDNVSVISGATDTVVASISVGSGPDAVVYDGETDEVYVANYGSDNVSAISVPAGSSATNAGTPTWVWIVLGALITATLVGAVVVILLKRREGGGPTSGPVGPVTPFETASENAPRAPPPVS